MMKALKKDLQAMVKGLMSLASKAEKMANGLDKGEKGKVGRPPGKRGRPVSRTPVAAAGRGKESTAMDMVYDIVARTKKGVDTGTIKEKTGFNDKKIWNAINRLKTQGKIKSARKGIYVKI